MSSRHRAQSPYYYINQRLNEKYDVLIKRVPVLHCKLSQGCGSARSQLRQWMGMVCFTPRPIYSHGKDQWFSLERGFGVCQAEKNICCCWNLNPNLRDQSAIAILNHLVNNTSFFFRLGERHDRNLSCYEEALRLQVTPEVPGMTGQDACKCNLNFISNGLR